MESCLLAVVGGLLLLAAPSDARLVAKGAPNGVIQVKTGKSVGLSTLVSSEPVQLWCQAIVQERRVAINITSAVFNSPNHTYPATIGKDGLVANLSQPEVPVTEAGKWSCNLNTSEGAVTGWINVYLRPIVFSHHVMRVDPRETSQFHFDASGVTTLKGDDAELTCPVYGNPVPRVQWRISGSKAYIKPGPRYAVSNNGTTLIIKNTTYEDENVYVCVAENNFVDPAAKRDVTNDLLVERRLRIKNPIAWLWPLLVIIFIFIALGLVIGICELRKRRNEQKLLITDPEED